MVWMHRARGTVFSQLRAFRRVTSEIVAALLARCRDHPEASLSESDIRDLILSRSTHPK